jgi:hypothetical protein
MAQSFIIQSVNVLCTYQISSAPNKIGYFKDSRDPTTVHLGQKQAILRVTDTKVERAFPCKMPGMIWGGLAMLVVGIAVAAVAVACVAAIIATGGAAAAVILPMAIAVTKGVLIATAIITAASIGIGIYAESHYCDNTQCSKWIMGHPKVLIEKQQALLSQSQLTCPVGGLLTLIINPQIAKKAAKMISDSNTGQLFINYGSKLAQGIIGGIFGGANLFSLSVSVGCEVYFNVFGHYVEIEKSKNKPKEDLEYKINNELNSLEDLGQSGVETSIGTGKDFVEAADKAAKYGKDAAQYTDEAARRALSGANPSVIREASDNALEAMIKQSATWKGFLFSLGRGIVGAAICFGIDQWAKSSISDKEQEIQVEIENFNKKDDSSSNFINIVAKDR